MIIVNTLIISPSSSRVFAVLSAFFDDRERMTSSSEYFDFSNHTVEIQKPCAGLEMVTLDHDLLEKIRKISHGIL